MDVIRILAAFVIAVLVTSVLAIMSSTMFVLGGLMELGVDIPMSEILGMLLYDLQGMSPLYGPLVGVGLLIAFLAAWGVSALLPNGLRGWVYMVAGAVAMVVMIMALEAQFGIAIVAGARSIAGLAVQALCGAVGGGLYGAMTRQD